AAGACHAEIALHFTAADFRMALPTWSSPNMTAARQPHRSLSPYPPRLIGYSTVSLRDASIFDADPISAIVLEIQYGQSSHACRHYRCSRTDRLFPAVSHRQWRYAWQGSTGHPAVARNSR